MRKTLAILAVATAAAISSPALAQSSLDPGYEPGNYVAPAAGVAVGTLAGVGLYNGWYTTTAGVSSLGATAAGAAIAGGVAGVGTAAVIDAAIQPCRGFHAMFMINPQECVNGQWVGDRAQPRLRRVR